MERCIVCGMDVVNSENTESTVIKDKTYYFCTALCKVLFLQEPEKYLDSVKDDEKKG